MATGGVSITLEGAENLKRGFRHAPGLTNTFVKQVFARGWKRWRRPFKATQLRGRPGIHAPTMAKLKDKNVTGFVTGRFEELAVFFKISRFLRWHTEGATIRKRGGRGTFHLPARLQFKSTVAAELPQITRETGDAALRAVRVSIERNQGRSSRGLSNLRRVR